VGQWHAAIFDSEPSSPDEDYAVLLLIGPSGCTGTLVAPNLVATARHCVVADPVPPQAQCDSDGNQLDGPLFTTDVAPGDVAVITGARINTEAKAHGAAIFTTGSNTICRNDLGFIVLDREIDDLPVVPLRLGATAIRSEPLMMVGYGLGGQGNRRKRSGLDLIDIGRSEFHNRASTAPPNTLLLPRSACAGDSGAPVVSEETGALVGIVSRTLGADCEDPTTLTIATQLAPYEALLNRAMEAAGAVPTLEGAESASGSSASCSVGGSASKLSLWLPLALLAARRARGRQRGRAGDRPRMPHVSAPERKPVNTGNVHDVRSSP
jgi:hypothetical protein